jgi:PadR family transcriptional regulator, regulator of vanillate utilization
MSLRNALLGVLDARPMSGYELSQFFDSASGWLWSAPQSQIYPTLKRMEAEGLIAGETSVRGSRLNRTVYSLTPHGRETLLSWVAEDHDPAPPRDQFAVQALLLDMIPADEAVAVLEAYAKRQADLADRYAAHADRLNRGDTPLLRERLKSRPESEHARTGRIKAHVFAGKAEVARQRENWAYRAMALVRDAPAT